MKTLEGQLLSLHERHHELQKSYSMQSNIVGQLTGKINEIQAEIDMLRSCSTPNYLDGQVDQHGYFDMNALDYVDDLDWTRMH